LDLVTTLTPATPDAAPWNVRNHAPTSSTEGRSSYDVDRDRIIHCETFRELQHKTQVQSLIDAPGATAFRTRLNHVLEVAQLSRGIARTIGATEALSEAIALAHDLGHPPFGHAGERSLRRVLAVHGFEGWNANVHSLDVVDNVEAAFVRFRGLDLTWATREGIARHSTPFDEPVSFGEFTETPHGGLECQIVDASDVLAYLSHDLDDALADEYIGLEEVVETSPILAKIVQEADRSWTTFGRTIWPEAERGLLIRRALIARLIRACIVDIENESQGVIARQALENPESVRATPDRVVTQSKEYAELTQSLLDLLLRRYYRSQNIREADERAERLIRGLFEALLTKASALPPRFRRPESELALSVASYLASLNDRSALELARKLGVADRPAFPAPRATTSG
jgi:dGTPase